MNQHDFVAGCFQWYLEADLQPGNPEDGEWHKCHYPVPRRLGGDKIILLLKEHHAVQGVLQSEEYQKCCVHGWEKKLLTGHLLDLYLKWRSEGSREVMLQYYTSMTEEEKTARALNMNERKTPENRRSAASSRMRKNTKLVFERMPRKTGIGAGRGGPGAVIVYLPEGGTLQYESLQEASVKTGVPRGTIIGRLTKSVEEQKERLWGSSESKQTVSLPVSDGLPPLPQTQNAV